MNALTGIEIKGKRHKKWMEEIVIDRYFVPLRNKRGTEKQKSANLSSVGEQLLMEKWIALQKQNTK